MSDAAELRRLQDFDTRIAELRVHVADIENLVRRDPAVEQAREATVAAAQQRQEREREATAAEAELNALQARVTSLDRKLYGGSVHNPHELLEMQHELEGLRHRVQEAEDRAVTLLDDAEHAAAAEGERIEALRGAEEKRASEMAPLRAQLASLTEQLADAVDDRETVVSSLDPRSLALYTRISGRRTPAVVGLSGDSCGGCHLPLSNEERRLVRAGKDLVQCSNCDRILVP